MGLRHKPETLLAMAEARILQCVIIGHSGVKKAIAVYMCGDDVFYARFMDGLFDASRRRKAPEWLKKQLTDPPNGVVILNYKGKELSPTATMRDDRPDDKQSESMLDDDDDDIGQG